MQQLRGRDLVEGKSIRRNDLMVELMASSKSSVSPLHFSPASTPKAVVGSSPAASAVRSNKIAEKLRCPRCDSYNTKFCYYNNYNLTQPRHFCKTCRRYWTKGGTLRNIPVGGGCRKSKSSGSTISSGPKCSNNRIKTITWEVMRSGVVDGFEPVNYHTSSNSLYGVPEISRLISSQCGGEALNYPLYHLAKHDDGAAEEQGMAAQRLAGITSGLDSLGAHLPAKSLGFEARNSVMEQFNQRLKPSNNNVAEASSFGELMSFYSSTPSSCLQAYPNVKRDH